MDPSVRETAAQTEPEAIVQDPDLVRHPSPARYVVVAVYLAVATAIEVGLYYMDLPKGVLTVLLLTLAVVKFALVALWFMHLRFDSPIFRRLFVVGIALAVSVYIIVLVSLGALRAPFLLTVAVLGFGLPAAAILLRARRVRVDALAEGDVEHAGVE